MFFRVIKVDWVVKLYEEIELVSNSLAKLSIDLKYLNVLNIEEARKRLEYIRNDLDSMIEHIKHE